MQNRIVEFLTAEYGQRVDFPQALVVSSIDSVQSQRVQVCKRLRMARISGILFSIVGLAWIVLSTISIVSSSWTAINLFQTSVGLIFFVAGLIKLHETAELSKKKMILETLLFMFQTED